MGWGSCKYKDPVKKLDYLKFTDQFFISIKVTSTKSVLRASLSSYLQILNSYILPHQSSLNIVKNFWYNIKCLLPLYKSYIVCRYIIQCVNLVISDTVLGSPHYKNVTMSLSKKVESPGYPHKNYSTNTNYTWYVIASDNTEEISIEITMDIHQATGFRCYDYLQVCVLQNDFYINPLVIEFHK